MSDNTSFGSGHTSNTSEKTLVFGQNHVDVDADFSAIFGLDNSRATPNNATGNYCLISGQGNFNNSGSWCSISGYDNQSNSGNYCSISGQYNFSNSGSYCSISGYSNQNNLGSWCSISGYYNQNNSGNYCSISGRYNQSNSGDFCLIVGQENRNNSGSYTILAGQNNAGNFGTHSVIGGGVTSGSTKIETTGTSATASTDLISKTSHGLTAGQVVRFTTLTGGTGLNTTLNYYVISDGLTVNSFKVASTPTGTAINITSDYSVANYIGNGINYGNYSVVIGNDCESQSGNYSAVFGRLNYNNSGRSSIITGDQNHSNSGSHCSISGGYNNSNSGNYTFISGSVNNSNSGHYCSISGYNNHTNAGDYCLIAGRENSSNAGDYAVLTGYQAANSLRGAVVHAAGNFGANGDAQARKLIARRSVIHNSAAWSSLTLDGATPAAGNRLVIPTDTVWNSHIKIVGTTQGCTKSFGFTIVCVVENDGGNTSILSNTVTTDYDTDDTDFDARVTADNTNNALLIEVSDATSGGDTVRWVAVVENVEVTFPA